MTEQHQEWTEIYDESSGGGGYYYYSNITGETTWEKPAAFIEQSSVFLPPGWTQVADEAGTPFYYNPDTGETSWEVPSSHTTEPPASADVVLPSGWTAVYDPENKRNYYYNAETGETVWDPPTSTELPTIEISAEPETIHYESEVHVPVSPLAVSTEWIEHTDPTTGKIFYENSKTHLTQWESPYESTEAINSHVTDHKVSGLKSPTSQGMVVLLAFYTLVSLLFFVVF
jgi:outer membrane protein assembly factor BamB